MLHKTLDSIRQKPRSVRDQYALGIAVCCTVLIGGVWTLSLPSRFSQTAALGNASTTESASPFSGLINQFKDQFKSAKAAIGTLPIASTTVAATSSVGEAENPLNFKLTDENKAELQLISSSSRTSEPVIYGMGMTSTTSVPSSGQTIMIATTSGYGTSTE